MIALISVAMLESVRSVAEEFSETILPLTLAEYAQPDCLSLVTDPSVKMMTSSSRLFSSMRDSTSACAAPGAHSLHSLPRVAMTVVYCSRGSSATLQALSFLTLLRGVQVSIVLADSVNHSLPLFSLHLTFLTSLSWRDLLVSAATFT